MFQPRRVQTPHPQQKNRFNKYSKNNKKEETKNMSIKITYTTAPPPMESQEFQDPEEAREFIEKLESQGYTPVSTHQDINRVYMLTKLQSE